MPKLTAQNTRYAINKAIKEAFELFSTKQYERAFKSFERILSIAPKNKDAKVENGVLADVAPSILHIMGMPQPADMTGRDLIK